MGKTGERNGQFIYLAFSCSTLHLDADARFHPVAHVLVEEAEAKEIRDLLNAALPPEGEIAALREVARLAVESQGWDGNNPDEERWSDFYAKARAAVGEGREEDEPTP